MSYKLPLWLCVVALLSITGLICILIATVYGVGVSPDSIAYIGAARNLVEGRGISLPYGQLQDNPLTQFPPLYPWLLAVGGHVGIDVLTGARWLQAILFGFLVFIVGCMLYRISGPWLAVGGSALVLTSPTLLTISSMAWTETLFLVLCLVAIWFLATFFESSNRVYFVVSALIVGVATLTRYSGIALVVTGCIALLFLPVASLQRRVLNCFLFAILSVLPLALWMFRNVGLTGTTTNRQFSFHPIGRTHLHQALDTISGWWMVPGTMPALTKLIIVLVPLLVIGVAFWPRPARTNPRDQQANTRLFAVRALPQVLALFAFTYSTFLALSISFADANTPLDARILSPVYLVGIFLILYAFNHVSTYVQSSRLSQVMLGIGITIFVALSVHQEIQIVVNQYRDGIGFASVAWQESEVIELTRKLPIETPIFSNAPDALYFLADRRTQGIPKKMNAMTQKPNRNYADELEIMRQTLEMKQGVVVYLTKLSHASASQEAELQRQFALSVLAQTDDGSIYGVASARELAAQ